MLRLLKLMRLLKTSKLTHRDLAPNFLGSLGGVCGNWEGPTKWRRFPFGVTWNQFEPRARAHFGFTPWLPEIQFGKTMLVVNGGKHWQTCWRGLRFPKFTARCGGWFPVLLLLFEVSSGGGDIKRETGGTYICLKTALISLVSLDPEVIMLSSWTLRVHQINQTLTAQFESNPVESCHPENRRYHNTSLWHMTCRGDHPSPPPPQPATEGPMKSIGANSGGLAIAWEGGSALHI